MISKERLRELTEMECIGETQEIAAQLLAILDAAPEVESAEEFAKSVEADWTDAPDNPTLVDALTRGTRVRDNFFLRQIAELREERDAARAELEQARTLLNHAASCSHWNSDGASCWTCRECHAFTQRREG